MSVKREIKAPSKKGIPEPSQKAPSRNGNSATISRSSSVSTLASVTEGRESNDGSRGATVFEVGEKVWVNGTKPGFVQYIGETQFAPGIWAGVKLDDCDGKNDGSVGGVRYFDCEPQRGIFIRPHRLTRQAGAPLSISSDSSLVSPQGKAGGYPGGSKHGAISSPSKPGCSKLRPGERIVVNSAGGVKMGVLRYLGPADFATGDWAGIELDDPLGKNDGSVGGKRYFECQMKHGLFAPIHKVSRAGGSCSRSASHTGSLQNRSYSRESLNSSVSSVASSRAGRVKLGITSLNNTQKPPKGGAAVLSPTQAALQEILKEKEEHIEQLLKERALERAEVARAAVEVEEEKQKFFKLQEDYKTIMQENEMKIQHLQSCCEKAQLEAKNAFGSLEEEKRKMEDLQFRFEEEQIMKSELEVQCQKINDLENQQEGDGKNQEFISRLAILEVAVKEKDERAATLGNELKNVHMQLSTKESEANVLASKLDAALKEVEALKSEFEKTKALETKVTVLEQQSSALEDERNKISSLMSEISTLSAALSDKENFCKEESAKLESLTKVLGEKDTLLTELNQRLQDVKKSCDDEVGVMKSHCQSLGEKISAIETECAKHRADLDEKKVVYEKERQDLHMQLKQEVDMKACLQSQITNLSNDLNTKDELVCKLTDQLKEAKDEISILSKDNSESMVMLQNKIEEMKHEAERKQSEFEAALEKAVSTEKEKLAQFLKEREELVKKNNTSETGIREEILQKEMIISQINCELQDANGKVETLSKSMNALEEQIRQARTEKDLWNNEKEELQQNLVNLKVEISQHALSLEEKIREANQKQNEVQQLQNSLKMKDDQISELALLIEGSQKQLAQLKQQNEQNVATMESQVMNFKQQQEKHLQEKEMVLQGEIERLQNQLTERDSSLESSQDKMSELQNTIKQKDSHAQELQQQLKEQEISLASSLERETKTLSELESKMLFLKSHCEKLEKEKDEIAQQEHAAREARRLLEKEKDVLMSDKLEQEALVMDRDTKLQMLQQEVERMRCEFIQHKDELQRKLDISQMELEAMKEFKSELEMQHGVLEELQQQLQESENERCKLQEQLKTLSATSDEKVQLEKRVSELTEALQTATNRANEETHEKQKLQNELQDYQKQLKQKDDELNVVKEIKVENQQESQALELLKSKLDVLEKEKIGLSNELSKLKTSLQEKSNSNNPADAEADDEKETLLSQINFLNSIIVDLQKKNEELKIKLESPNDIIDTDINYNGVRQLPPRLFCDICDMFDLHDTEDCPTQSSFTEEVPHSRHQGNRHEERPYCNNCEVFGHWTLECNDQQTF